MKRITTASLIILATLALAAGAHAFGPHGKCKNAHNKMGMKIIHKYLDLSEEQETTIRALHREMKAEHPRQSGHFELLQLDPGSADFATQSAELAEKRAEQVRNAMLARAELHSKVYEILTDEQREKLSELKSEMKEGKRGNKHHW